ncbi:ATP-NAD kinase-like domain-containing protein [Scleroderma yunnanense]
MSSLELTITDSIGVLTTWTLTETSLHIRTGTSAPSTPWLPLRPNNRAVTQIPIRNVIAVTLSSDHVEVSYVARKSPKSGLSLFRVSGSPSKEGAQFAEQWCGAAMAAAYQGRSPPKKLKILVNPHGGQGKANTIYENKVEPILRAAGCTLDVTRTTHTNHAVELAEDLSLDYDALVIVSGDGLIHEVLNGFLNHAQSEKAFCIPIAPIPAGSGNGLSLNLLGLQDGLDPCAAALNVLKGHALKVDLFSFTQGNQKRMSFMSQTVGLMADIDIETEHLRWMGDLRFILGFLQSVVKLPACKMELSIKVAEQDKSKMVDALHARRNTASFDSPSPTSTRSEHPDDTPGSSGETWIKFDKPCLWMYAGKGPYVSRTLMQFPVSQPDDGFIDVTIQEIVSRKELLNGMNGADRGRCYWLGSNHYFKASAYRAKPLADSGGMLVVDGEPFPFEEYQVEVLPRLGTLLSPHPHYAPEFPLREVKESDLRQKT